MSEIYCDGKETAPFENYPRAWAETAYMPGFVHDMCIPLFDEIRQMNEEDQVKCLGNYWYVAIEAKEDDANYYPQSILELALDAFIGNIWVNQPQEGAPPNNALLLFMEVASVVWEIKGFQMPNTKHRNEKDQGMCGEVGQ
jgi:hypothetical protein